MCCGGSPPPPDYGPLANASKESAEIMAQLGREQLDESKRQYEKNIEIAQPVVQAQLGIMEQAKAQGDDYYAYMKENQRPLEEKISEEAMAAGGEAAQTDAAGRAVADVRQGSTAAANMMMRQGMRYGYSPTRMAVMAGTMASRQGLAEASAANQAREKEKQIGFAKKLDAAGMYRGMPGASQGAYGVATNSGNSAVNNQMAPGGQLMAGMGQGASTIGSGRQMALGGLGSVLNAQTSAYNAGQAASGSTAQSVGALMGGAASMAMAFSDPRLKEGIVEVGRDEPTGLTLYEFSYLGSDDRWRGVMADEVLAVRPDAVHETEYGYLVVDYESLGMTCELVTKGGDDGSQ